MSDVVFSDKRVEELLKSPDFLTKLINSEDLNEAKGLFAKEGVSVKIEDLNKIFKIIDNIVVLNKNGKLDDNNLEKVSGGEFFLTAAAVVAIISTIGSGATYYMKGKAENIKQQALSTGQSAELMRLEEEVQAARLGGAFDRYKNDKAVALGSTGLSLAAALLLLNYHKKDIYKFWNSKKKAWFGDQKDVKSNN